MEDGPRNSKNQVPPVELGELGDAKSGRRFRPRLPSAARRAERRAARAQRSRWQKIRHRGAVALVAATGSTLAIAAVINRVNEQIDEGHAEAKLLGQQNTYNTDMTAAATAENNQFDSWMSAGPAATNSSVCAEHNYVLEAGLTVFKQPTKVADRVGKTIKTNVAYVIPQGTQQVAHKMQILKNGSGQNAHEMAGFTNLPVEGVASTKALRLKTGTPLLASQVAAEYNWIDLTEAKTNDQVYALRLPHGPQHKDGIGPCPWTTAGQPVFEGDLAAWSISGPENDPVYLDAIGQALK